MRYPFKVRFSIGTGDSAVPVTAWGDVSGPKEVAYNVSSSILSRLKGAHLLTGEPFKAAYLKALVDAGMVKHG